jgi:hypothetical protein
MSGANVFNRLSFSFDTNKFGDAIYLSQETKNFLNTQPISLETWQKNDLANGTIIATNYYKNPMLGISNQLRANAQNLLGLLSSINSYDYAGGIPMASSTSGLIGEIELYKEHTSNVAGVTKAEATVPEDGSPVIEYPDYDSAVQLGQNLLMLLNNTDGIQDSTPLLGSMTSLFISDEIVSNTITIGQDYSTVNMTLRTDIDANGNVIILSNITTDAANLIVTHVQSANGMLNTRRLHDWNFFRQGLILLEDSNKIENLENVGNTQLYLINNLIGTDDYKKKLASNTANTNSS